MIVQRKRLAFVAILLALGLSVRPTTAASADDVHYLRDKIQETKRRLAGDPTNKTLMDELLSECENALKLDPTDPANHILLGEAFQKRGDLAKAEDQYKQALRLAPGNSTAEALLRAIGGAAAAPSAASEDPDVQRFRALKDRRHRLEMSVYIAQLKSALDREWKPAAHSGLLKTKCRVLIDPDGKLDDYSVMTASKSHDEDESVSHLVHNYHFSPLPHGIMKSELYLTFMADEEMSMVDVSAQAEEPFVGVSAPSPSYAGATQRSGGPAIAVAPSVPRPSGGNSRQVSDVDCGPYMAYLQHRIKEHWSPPKGDEDKRIVVEFSILRDGSLRYLRLSKSSGKAGADQAALKAVEQAAPFRQLPAGASDDVDIQYTFDWNVFAHGGHGVFKRL